MTAKVCSRGTKRVGNRCVPKTFNSIKIRTKNFWKNKNIDMSLSGPDVKGERIVAIGEELEPNTNAFKFIHLDVGTFLDFADKVKRETR